MYLTKSMIGRQPRLLKTPKNNTKKLYQSSSRAIAGLVKVNNIFRNTTRRNYDTE